MKRIISILLLCLLPVSTLWASNVAQYSSLKAYQEADGLKVVLDLRRATQFKSFSLHKPERFVVDVYDTILEGNAHRLDLAKLPFKSVRAGIRKGDDLRFVFDLSQRLDGKVYMESHGKGQRLVIKFPGYGVAAHSAKASTSVPKATVAKPAVSAAPKVAVTSAPRPTMSASHVVNDAKIRDIVVAIDAGHGGVDPGALGRKGTREKDVVLQIARELEALVKREPGMRPVMIRNGDYFLTLRQRIAKARDHKADIFISVHADAFNDPRARGASVYTLSDRGATTEAAKLLADRENASDLFGEVTLSDKDDMLASVLLDLSQSATIEASVDVADRVLRGLKKVGKVHKRHVEQASFTVLKSPDIPSILVETAFISNPNEESNLRSKKHQQKLAVAMLDGVRSYFTANPLPGTRIAAAREHVIKSGDTLSAIAQRYQVSTRSLRSANQLKTDVLHVGRVLQIPIGS